MSATVPAHLERARSPRTLLTALAGFTGVGLVVPNAMVASYVARHGLDLGGYFGAWVASVPATQLTLDLVVVATGFAVWSRADSRRTGARWWPVLPATFLVGICFALPLYLWQRERALLHSTNPSGETHV